MLATLLLATVAVSAADYIVPIYEDPDFERPEDLTRHACTDDCHHHLLNGEVFILLRDHNNEEIPYSRVYAPRGLNGLLATPLKEKLLNYLKAQHYVGIIYPFKSFHGDLYPGVLDADVVIPEHTTTLRKLHREKPVLVLVSQPEFVQFNENKGYKQIVELGLGDKGFKVVKDFAPEVRHAVKPRQRFGIDIHFNT